MISMEMMGKIRRMYFRDKLSLHQIAKRTGLSRNAIRKWVRAPEATQPAYQRCATFNKLSPFHATLEQALKADSFRAKHNRRSAKALFEQIKAEGYGGGYSQLTSFIRSWRGEQGKSLRAFVPLTFALGDPMLWQQLIDLTRSLRRQARQHIFEIRVRIMPIQAG